MIDHAVQITRDISRSTYHTLHITRYISHWSVSVYLTQIFTSNSGQEVGLEIWRVVKFKIEKWAKEDYGKFFSGDSYIVLNTYKYGVIVYNYSSTVLFVTINNCLSLD